MKLVDPALTGNDLAHEVVVVRKILRKPAGFIRAARFLRA